MNEIDFTKYSDLSTLELRKKLHELDANMSITGTSIQKTVAITGNDETVQKEFLVLYTELRKRTNSDYEFFKWLTTKPETTTQETEKLPTIKNKPFNATHKFYFGGGFEIPYNIYKGEAYNDDGSVLASVDMRKYRNHGHAVPSLHSVTKAALKAKLIANGNHDAALHL